MSTTIASPISAAIDGSAFAREISLAASIAKRGTSIPILSNVLLEAGQGRLTITVNDLECALSTSIEAQCEPGARVTCPAKKLSEYARAFAPGEMKLAIGPLNVCLKSGTSAVVISGLDADLFPESTSVPEPSATIPTASLIRLVRQTRYAISAEESRFTINGAQLQIRDASVSMVAADGHRLVFAQESGGGSPQHHVVPRKALQILELLLNGRGTPKEVIFAADESHVFFTAGNRTLIARKIIAPNFPDYRKVLPKKFSGSSEFNVREMATALRRAKLAADKRSGQVKLTFKEAAVQVESSVADEGTFSGTLPAVNEGKGITICFHLPYLLDTLGAMTAERAIARFNGPKNAIQLEPVDCIDVNSISLAIIMPMRF